MLHQHEKLTLPQIRLALADRYGAAVLDEIIAEFQSLDVIPTARFGSTPNRSQSLHSRSTRSCSTSTPGR